VSDFLRALHVLAAVLLIGPLVAAPFLAWWAIRRRNAQTVRLAANLMATFGAGALLVAGLGLGTLLTGTEWTLATPWVLISATLFVVALALIAGYAVPGLRRAASLVAEEAAATAAPIPVADVPAATSGRGNGASAKAEPAEDASDAGAGVESAGPEAVLGSAADRTGEDRRRQRLDSITARVTGAGWLLLAVFAAIVILMTWRPFE
jgi:uncharacterized membrane protein